MRNMAEQDNVGTLAEEAKDDRVAAAKNEIDEKRKQIRDLEKQIEEKFGEIDQVKSEIKPEYTSYDSQPLNYEHPREDPTQYGFKPENEEDVFTTLGLPKDGVLVEQDKSEDPGDVPEDHSSTGDEDNVFKSPEDKKSDGLF